jgi:hypothetical protein
VFRRSLGIIEKEENGGLPPEKLAQRIVRLVEMKNPPLRNVVANLPDETVAYPGHGPKTTIGEEKRMNPYLR